MRVALGHRSQCNAGVRVALGHRSQCNAGVRVALGHRSVAVLLGHDQTV